MAINSSKMMFVSFFNLCIVAVVSMAYGKETKLGDEILEYGPGRIFFVGHPMIDIYCSCEQSVVDELGFRKGESNGVNREIFLEISKKVKVESKNAGGSSAASARSYSFLGGEAGYSGLSGDDEECDTFEQCLSDYGVRLHIQRRTDHFTTQLYSLVTPDAERTMYPLFGASHVLKKGDIPVSIMDSYDFYAFNGYMFANSDMIEFTHNMIDETLKRGKRLITMFANSFCIRHFGKYLKPISEKSAYIIGNLEEFTELYEVEDQETLFRMFEQRTSGDKPQHVAIAITMGSKGAYIIYQGKRLHVPAPQVKVVDTTGAGDFFAGGLFYGLLNGWTVKQAGMFAAEMAGDIISHYGTLVSDNLQAKIVALKKKIKEDA